MENNIERRFYQSPVTIEKRAGEENKFATIKGIAAKVGVKTDMGWYEEMIEPGAFDDVMNDDVRCLFNHCEDRILARTKSGTLKINLDENGNLAYEYTTPNRSYALDLQDAIEKGDVSQSSFAFIVKEASWTYPADGSNEKELRKIIKFERLMDVSPVTFAAYEDTEVAKRSRTAKPEADNKNAEIELMHKSLELELLK